MQELKVSKNITFKLTNLQIVEVYREERGIANFSTAVNEIIELWVRKERIIKELENIAQERAAKLESMERKIKIQEKFKDESKRIE